MKSVATKQGIQNFLTAPVDVEVFDCVNSTNTYAKQLVKGGKCGNFAIVAREQTLGRGRFERRFFSPKDCGVYLSLVVAPRSEDELAMLTPLCAVATLRAIKATLGKDVEIKWVNDLYFEKKKCVGILCEAVSVNSKISAVVLGIGVNLYEPDGGVDDEIKDIVSFLGDGSEDCADRLIACIIEKIVDMHNNFDKAQIAKEYKEHSFLIGKTVDVCKLDDSVQSALVVDIDQNCNLVVQYDCGRVEKLSAGEVRIKC